ncbi:MAG: zinc finger domain-containing protein [Methanolobus sp.]|nr:zinc finger domain-containing protein [Methanolobus sp.]
MANKVENCTTCKKNLVETGYVRFPCPVCGTELGRCISCRQQSNPYKCPKCGFVGA